MEQISYDEGSGGYHSPAAAAARFTSMLRAPGSTRAVRVATSISIPVIRSNEMVSAPSTADDPPESPLPAPRGTTGVLVAVAHLIAATTCSVERALRTAHGI